MQYLAKINKNVFFHINQSKTLFFFFISSGQKQNSLEQMNMVS